jgi:hypothetical protein
MGRIYLSGTWRALAEVNDGDGNGRERTAKEQSQADPSEDVRITHPVM